MNLQSNRGNRAALAFALVMGLGMVDRASADDQPPVSLVNSVALVQVNPGAMNRDELVACANSQLDVEARMAEVELRRQALDVRQARYDEDAGKLERDVDRFNADSKRKKEPLQELQRRKAAQKTLLAAINREVDELNRYVKLANELNRAQRQNCAFRSFRLDDAAKLSAPQRAAMGVEDIERIQQERRSWDAASECANFEQDYSAGVVDSFNELGSRARFPSNASCTVSLTVTVDPAGKLILVEIHHMPSDCPDEVLAFAQRRIQSLRCTNASGKQRVESVDMRIEESKRQPNQR